MFVCTKLIIYFKATLMYTLVGMADTNNTKKDDDLHVRNRGLTGPGASSNGSSEQNSRIRRNNSAQNNAPTETDEQNSEDKEESKIIRIHQMLIFENVNRFFKMFKMV